MNASSNALVGELRKHPCGALGAGKQQRLAAGGSRGAHVARLGSAGARLGSAGARSERKHGENAQTQPAAPQAPPRSADPRDATEAQRMFADQIRVDPLCQLSFLFGKGSGPLWRGGEKQRTPELRRRVR